MHVRSSSLMGWTAPGDTVRGPANAFRARGAGNVSGHSGGRRFRLIHTD
ncbi:hypothetical protein SUBVAR_06346 [Subdoligranulum variabile DSM 15176]|uniref:Uncharacterized protein n=1 Tax=Subdoligranulum variabile DSM 15176 TaxID=411471 RepID=D1PPM8_9FIRM|nr:hypothetical protein SUBVAR_06346 [Subdoligranulum variabile DSM 15176]